MRYRDASAIVPLLVQESRTNDARTALAEDVGIVTCGIPPLPRRACGIDGRGSIMPLSTIHFPTPPP